MNNIADHVLTGTDGRVRLLFHYSQKNIPNFQFKPLTHFGTCQAAHERWCGTNPSGHNTRIYPCVLKMKNPLRVFDTGDIGLRLGPQELLNAGVSPQRVRWVFQPFLKSPILNKTYDSQASRHNSWQELDFRPEAIAEVTPKKILKAVFSLFAKNNFTQPLSKKEVESEINFMLPEHSPRLLLARERMITALTEMEIDGLVYENREEDFGKDSFCIFTPDQVISAFDFDWEENNMPTPELRENHRYYIREIYTPSNTY